MGKRKDFFLVPVYILLVRFQKICKHHLNWNYLSQNIFSQNVRFSASIYIKYISLTTFVFMLELFGICGVKYNYCNGLFIIYKPKDVSDFNFPGQFWLVCLSVVHCDWITPPSASSLWCSYHRKISEKHIKQTKSKRGIIRRRWKWYFVDINR